jgi:quinol-cytochrome oxidoreductase complex cytochrome b subunit
MIKVMIMIIIIIINSFAVVIFQKYREQDGLAYFLVGCALFSLILGDEILGDFRFST